MPKSVGDGAVAVPVDKPLHGADHTGARVAVRLMVEEGVYLPLELQELHRFPHGLEPCDVVRGGTALLVELGRQHQHRRERDAVQRGVPRRERVRQRVVLVPRGGPQRQRQAPQRVVLRHSAEDQADHRAPGDAHGVQAEAAQPEADSQMVDDVPAGRVAAEERPPEISRFREPGVGDVLVRRRRRLAAQPGQGGLRVVEGRGEAVLRREAVVRGQHDGRELTGEAEAAGVEVGLLEAAQYVPAAVEVDEHRELLLPGAGGGVRRRPVHAELEVVASVVYHVLPLDGGLVGRRRRGRERVREADHRAVAEELEERAQILHDVRWRRRRRGGGRHGLQRDSHAAARRMPWARYRWCGDADRRKMHWEKNGQILLLL
uniref:Uncharacterized protein n=1 Tax=Avena sativa TaxID=4498 RepID=A0ACD5WB68_AVESA